MASRNAPYTENNFAPYRDKKNRLDINRDRHLFLLTSLLQDDRRRLNQFNNSVFFKGKHKEAEEFHI